MEAINEINQDELVEELLLIFKEQRLELNSLIKDISKFREKLDTILPDKVENRYKFIFEEKIKAITNLYSAILSMRQEISKLAKNEIEIRKKLKSGDANIEDILNSLDIRDIIKKQTKKANKVITN